MANEENRIKLVLVGETQVGKTSIYKRFLHNGFTEKMCATIVGEAEYNKQFKYKKNVYNIDLYDTAGQERFRSTFTRVFKEAQGIFVVFDLTNEYSFEAIKGWLQLIKDKAPSAKIIFLGNKADLKEKRNMNKEDIEKNLRQLKELEILKDLTNLVNNEIIYYEISAKKDKNITEAIQKMISLIKGISEDDAKEKTEGNADEQSEKTTCPCLHSCNLI